MIIAFAFFNMVQPLGDLYTEPLVFEGIFTCHHKSTVQSAGTIKCRGSAG